MIQDMLPPITADMASCLGRRSYPNRAKAEKAIARHRGNKRHGLGKLHAYACHHCCGWHLGRMQRG